ncbi:ankyrin repeat-containing domain protein, partial [Trichophaea hybrida]
ILLEKGANIWAVDISGKTALHLAAYEGHVSIVKLLLEMNCDIEFSGNFSSRALHVAAQEGHDSMVLFLLDLGAYIDAKDLGECTVVLIYTALILTNDICSMLS